MEKIYVEKRDAGYWIKDTRVSLDSLVYAFQDGASPETIRHRFPVLTLEEVYGAITFYLANQREIDDHLAKANARFEAEAEARREQIRHEKPELLNRLDEARQGDEVTP